MPIFVFPAPFGVRLDGGQDVTTHRRRGFGQPVLPDSPVIISAVPASETQRASRGKHRLLSAHDRQIYVVWPYDGYRALSCVVSRRRIPALPRLKSACPLPLRVRGIPVPRIKSGAGLTHVFASGFLQAYIAVPPLPSATLRLRRAGYGLCPIRVS